MKEMYQEDDFKGVEGTIHDRERQLQMLRMFSSFVKAGLGQPDMYAWRISKVWLNVYGGYRRRDKIGGLNRKAVSMESSWRRFHPYGTEHMSKISFFLGLRASLISTLLLIAVVLHRVTPRSKSFRNLQIVARVEEVFCCSKYDINVGLGRQPVLYILVM